MKTRSLNEAEFRSTFAEPMEDITKNHVDVIDIWPYVRAVPSPDLMGHEIYDQFVEYVYRSADNQFDHVLVMTRSSNVYLVVVVEVSNDEVFGHRLLDLNKEYGLAG